MTKKKAWRLIFAKGLLDNYIEGEAVWTFRKYSPGSHEFIKGQIIEGHFLDGVMLLLEVIEDTQIKPFRNITEKEREEWGGGKTSQRRMMQQLQTYYPGLTLDDTAALIKTRLARISDRPIAGPLPTELLSQAL